jgi:hypothetical protein
MVCLWMYIARVGFFCRVLALFKSSGLDFLLLHIPTLSRWMGLVLCIVDIWGSYCYSSVVADIISV